MTTTRRTFLQQSAAAMAMMMAPQGVRRPPAPPARPVLDPSSLSPFVDALPIPAIAKPDGLRPVPADTKSKVPFYRLSMRQVEYKVHRDVKATKMWGTQGTSPGPTIEA